MEQFRIGRVSAYKRSDGSRWSLYWRIDGKRVRKTIDSSKRSVAVEIAEKVWHALQTHDYVAVDQALSIPVPKSIAFSDVLDGFEASCPSEFRSILTDQPPSTSLLQITVSFDGWQISTWKGNLAIRRRIRLIWADIQIRALTPTMVEQFL